MGRFIIIAFLISSCVGIQPTHPNSNNCGMVIVGDWKDNLKPATLSKEDLDDRLAAALGSSAYVTDWHFMDTTELCQKLVGYRMFTVPERSFTTPDKADGGLSLSGANWCWSKTIVVGTPLDGGWRSSSIVHEIYHAWQDCDAGMGPPDRLNDTDHMNWERTGIYNAIDLAREL